VAAAAAAATANAIVLADSSDEDWDGGKASARWVTRKCRLETEATEEVADEAALEAAATRPKRAGGCRDSSNSATREAKRLGDLRSQGQGAQATSISGGETEREKRSSL
jgi:hypothetical protein